MLRAVRRDSFRRRFVSHATSFSHDTPTSQRRAAPARGSRSSSFGTGAALRTAMPGTRRNSAEEEAAAERDGAAPVGGRQSTCPRGSAQIGPWVLGNQGFVDSAKIQTILFGTCFPGRRRGCDPIFLISLQDSKRGKYHGCQHCFFLV